MIIRGGENVYPREIEEFLFRHPKVEGGGDCRRAGPEVWRSDLRLDSPARGQDSDEQEIRDFCHGQIAHYKVPRYVRFVPPFRRR